MFDPCEDLHHVALRVAALSSIGLCQQAFEMKTTHVLRKTVCRAHATPLQTADVIVAVLQ